MPSWNPLVTTARCMTAWSSVGRRMSVRIRRGNVLESTLGAHNCDAMRSNFDRIFCCEGCKGWCQGEFQL